MSSSGWIDREQDPWGVTVKAFLRKEKDIDGITVLPSAHLCFGIDIRGVGKIQVDSIESVTDPVTGKSLHVTEDSAEHGFIENVPFHSKYPKEANDIATELATMCELLNDSDFQCARELWKARKATEPIEWPLPE